MLSCLWLAEYFIAVCLISDLRWFAVMPGYVQHSTHAGNDKMKCRYCQEDIKFTNSHLHSSNLRNHLTFKHPEKLSVPEKAKVPKINDYFTGHKSSLPSLPALDRQTLAVCCSAHPLRFNLVCNYFKDFLFDNETSSIFTSPADILAVQTWALHVLPSTNLEVFKAEATEIDDVKNLGQPVVPANFRIHKTLANLILKVVVSEACVERAFSRHKLFHSNLRANLKAEKLDEQLFLRYNFQNMIDIASTVNQSHGESDDDDDFLPFEWLCSKFVGCLKFKLTV